MNKYQKLQQEITELSEHLERAQAELDVLREPGGGLNWMPEET